MLSRPASEPEPAAGRDPSRRRTIALMAAGRSPMPLGSKHSAVCRETAIVAPVSARPATVPRAQWARRRPAACARCATGCALVYGRPLAPPHGQGLDELILTVLSQSTNDRNRDVAFLRLRERFAELGGGPRRPERGGRGGDPARRHLARSSRRGSRQILRALDGPADARRTCRPGVAEARDELTALPGVGRKTAACVLLFAFGMRDVPVDTHVSRVGTRLGLFRPEAPFEELHDDDARAHAARAGARVPRQPAPPRPPDVPRAAPGLRRSAPCCGCAPGRDRATNLRHAD